MRIELLFHRFALLQNEIALLQLMRRNGQTSVAEQERNIAVLHQKFQMECDAFNDAFKIALTSKSD